MGEKSRHEEAALKKFRPLAANLCHHPEQMRDENLLQWLRARDCNIKAAEEMLRKAMLWRQKNKIDEILAWQAPSEFVSQYPYDMDGEDKEGYPVFLVPLGRWDIRRAYESGHQKLMRQYIDQLLERALEKARMKNLTDPGSKYVNQAVFIWDLDGLTMRQMTSTGMIDVCLDICKNLENHYPEIMKISISINGKFKEQIFEMRLCETNMFLDTGYTVECK
ncbi:unnamed protein product [Allacma fusca]|uniref:CRAL-TRIO domain-containing protein n=1 Tax=Allacma fusca TaxID=39272 RepID=A0A8J2K7L7_9HEXA|nr:unnamed protein product [Allacma fusca]